VPAIAITVTITATPINVPTSAATSTLSIAPRTIAGAAGRRSGSGNPLGEADHQVPVGRITHAGDAPSLVERRGRDDA
jgi:hypothetical protein